MSHFASIPLFETTHKPLPPDENHRLARGFVMVSKRATGARMMPDRINLAEPGSSVRTCYAGPGDDNL